MCAGQKGAVVHSIQELQYMKAGTEGQKTSRPIYHKECLSGHPVGISVQSISGSYMKRKRLIIPET